MKNEKIFVGNLNFSATEDNVKELLSEYGTVVTIRYSRKKGHAVAEMSDREESEAVIRNLDGKTFMDRTLRVNFELPSKKAKSETVKRFNEKGKSLSEGKEEAPARTRSHESGSKKTAKHAEGRSSGRQSDQQRPKSREGFNSREGSKSAPRGNRRDDSDDSRGNRKSSYDSDSSRDRDSIGGYYSQSFRKRAEKAAHAFSKFKTKDDISANRDDFMKDEHGRDYRDMNDESGRRRPARGAHGSQNSGSGNRQRSRSASDSGRSYGERSDSTRRTPRRDDGESSGRPSRSSSGRPSGNGPRGNSRSGSDSSYGEGREGTRRSSGKPRSSGERSGNTDRRGSSHGEKGNSSSRRSSGSRPSDRSRNKDR